MKQQKVHTVNGESIILGYDAEKEQYFIDGAPVHRVIASDEGDVYQLHLAPEGESGPVYSLPSETVLALRTA
ncbi:MAG: hypothetical protein M5U01_15450 [Ardenticatenaceae bacterium]|nr:hypothetical protein [Ardenticatenaceae bacterium]